MFKIGDRVVYNDKTYKTIGKSDTEYLDDSGKTIRECSYTIKSEDDGIRHIVEEKDLQLAKKYHIVITENGKEIVNKDIDAEYIGHLTNPLYFKISEGIDIADDYIFCK